jgi:DNA replication and repair protein RecF
LACLEKARLEEIARGITTIGPHRDDFRFISNKIDVGVYGSRGQARTAVLAVKLAEVAWIKNKTGRWPVLLLDEVLAELDSERREDLLGRLSEAQQVLSTTTELDAYSHEFARDAAIWFVREGRLNSIEGDALKEGD